MKKLFFATLLAALTLGVSSCKDNSNENESLAGTSWMNDDTGFVETFVFKTSSTGSYDVDGGIEVEFSGSTPFTYTYTHPTVTVTVTEDGDTDSITGTVSGNTLTFPYVDEEGASISRVFTKQ